MKIDFSRPEKILSAIFTVLAVCMFVWACFKFKYTLYCNEASKSCTYTSSSIFNTVTGEKKFNLNEVERFRISRNGIGRNGGSSAFFIHLKSGKYIELPKPLYYKFKYYKDFPDGNFEKTTVDYSGLIFALMLIIIALQIGNKKFFDKDK